VLTFLRDESRAPAAMMVAAQIPTIVIRKCYDPSAAAFGVHDDARTHALFGWDENVIIN